MRIYSMTATFGKLEHETLTLEAGLNVIHAPNEWGKSTWCAFVEAMLYGIETRVKSTKTSLADKEHYAPWSGSPMSGRMDVEWHGRRITLERRTKGRVPMGEFRAYETETGIPVPELTGTNCGEMLTGVERSVFTRAGFIRFRDMPLTQDDALRRRLNALVTTGDESGDGERLARGLKTLKNRCRSNRTTGEIPKLMAQRDEVENSLRTLDTFAEQEQTLHVRLTQVNDWLKKLETHRDFLRYEASRETSQRIAQAQSQCGQWRERLDELEMACRELPSREEAWRNLEELNRVRQAYLDTKLELAMLPPPPQLPQPPEVFRGLDGEGAMIMVCADGECYAEIAGKRSNLRLVIGILLAILGAALLAAKMPAAGLAGIVGGMAVIGLWIVAKRKGQKILAAIEEKYGSAEPKNWIALAQEYAANLDRWQKENCVYQQTRQALDDRIRAGQAELDSRTQGMSPEECLKHWQDIVSTWDEWADARREFQKAENLAQTLASMAKPVEKPDAPDSLDYSETETTRLISDASSEKKQIESRLHQYQGRMETLDSREKLLIRLEGLNQRIRALEEFMEALTLAQEALAETVTELQRRFAPRISLRTQELMGELTGGRYTRIQLGEDLSLEAATGEENTLFGTMWRSDGTVDQLYLALRLAVAEALTGEAPLILDDALVRFDDVRLNAALRILHREAADKQVILFTCQEREKRLLDQLPV